MNANEVYSWMLAGYADSDGGYHDATQFQYRLYWYWCWFMYHNFVFMLWKKFTQGTGFTNLEFYNQRGGGHAPSASCGLV